MVRVPGSARGGDASERGGTGDVGDGSGEGGGVSAAAWPEPYLQPDRNQDCGFYTAAYIARCIGDTECTAGRVKAWRELTRYHETAYPRDVTGARMQTFASLELSTAERAEYYMGPGREAWVRRWLADGWIGYATVFRVPGMAHAVAVLGAGDDGVLLMDPLSGHVTEPWDWFLGIGPGRYGCHYVESWYRA